MHITTACLALGLGALGLLNGVYARPLDPSKDLNSNEDTVPIKMDPYSPGEHRDPVLDSALSDYILYNIIELQAHDKSLITNSSNDTGLSEPYEDADDKDAEDADDDDEDADNDEDDIEDVDDSTLSRRSATSADPDSKDQDGKDPDNDDEDDSTAEEDAEHQLKDTKLTVDEYKSMIYAQKFLLGVDPGQLSAGEHQALVGFYADLDTIIMRGHKKYDAEVKDHVGFALDLFKHAPRREGDYLETVTHHNSTVAKRSLGPVPFGNGTQKGEPALTPAQQEKLNVMVKLFMETYHSENATVAHDKRADTQASGTTNGTTSQATEESVSVPSSPSHL